jgi:spore maturation protein SpmB
MDKLREMGGLAKFRAMIKFLPTCAHQIIIFVISAWGLDRESNPLNLATHFQGGGCLG